MESDIYRGLYWLCGNQLILKKFRLPKLSQGWPLDNELEFGGDPKLSMSIAKSERVKSQRKFIIPHFKK